MLKRLPTALAQVKTRNRPEITKWNQTNHMLFVLSKKNHRVIKQNGYYIYEFWKE